MSPDVFVIGTVYIGEASKLADYIRYYLNAGVPPSRILIGIRNDPWQAALAAHCAKIIKDHGLPFSQELSTEDSPADWRQNVQDEYIQDEDWVVHADAGQLVHIPWADNDFVLAAEWMNQHQFDALRGRVITRYMLEGPEQEEWCNHPVAAETNVTRMAMTRGYWYTCDDGNLCPEFQDSAWMLNRPAEIHELTYEKVSMTQGHRPLAN